VVYPTRAWKVDGKVSDKGFLGKRLQEKEVEDNRRQAMRLTGTKKEGKRGVQRKQDTRSTGVQNKERKSERSKF